MRRSHSELPSTFRTLAHSMRLAFRAEPRLVVASMAMAVLAAVPDGLYALWLALFAAGVAARDLGMLVATAVGITLSATGGWVLQTIGDRIERKFRMRVGAALETHVADLQASVPTVEHHERPEYLDRIAVLRNSAFQLDHMFQSLYSTIGALVRLGITVGLLISVHPVMALLVLFAVPTVLVSSWRSGRQRAVEERTSEAQRLSRHLFDLSTTAGPAKELRLAGIADRLVRERRRSWRTWYLPTRSAHWRTALWQAGAWALFGTAFLAAVVFAIVGVGASAGTILLVLAAGSRLSQYVAMTAGEADFLRMWLDASRRLAWLEDFAARHAERADRAVPDRIRTGIRFRKVSFRYPGTDVDVLRDVDLELPAGAVVAVVGDNGAGKSTLVKLLARMYEPTEGEVLLDDVPLGRMPAAEWRGRLAGSFQDFVRFELRAGRSVGLGDLPRMDDPAALATAVGRANAGDVVDRLVDGYETQLGPTWPGGVGLSFGQWQKIALARGFMRDDPLLLVLDEPTAALDAETEHELFERFAGQARAETANGRVTLLVSHRFSTVRMADLIVVLKSSRVVEVGSHDELLARDGLYRELYDMQARAYG